MVGVVLADLNTLKSMNQEKFECLVIVETTLSRLEPNPSWDDVSLDDQRSKWDFYDLCNQDWGAGMLFCGSPFSCINPRSGPFPFDPRYYSKQKPWPLYEVLLIERQGDVAYRIGIGYVHVDAFNPLATEKRVKLG